MPHETPDELKTRLIARLDEGRAHTQRVLDDAPPERVVHPASGWRVKDLVAHITAWEQEVVTGLEWLQQGKTYIIPDLTTFDDYNARVYPKWRDLPYADIRRALDETRARFKALIRAMPPDQVETAVMSPWRTPCTLAEMVAIMAHHERYHVDEIEQAVPADS